MCIRDRALAGRELAPAPGRSRPAARPAPVDPLSRGELEAVRALLEVERAHAAELRAGHADALALARDLAEAERRRADDLARELEAVRAELAGARAELEALRAAAGLPWWRRLLGSAPRLPDNEA